MDNIYLGKLCNEKNINMIDKLSPEIISQLYYYSYKCIEEKKGYQKFASDIINYINKKYKDNFKGTITLTFGEVAESHVGMEKIGVMADKGFSVDDIENASEYFQQLGIETQIICLNDYLPDIDDIGDIEEKKILKKQKNSFAKLLVIRNALSVMNDKGGKKLLTEMLLYEWDTKMYNSRKKVVQNKNARHNLNFDSKKQKNDFSSGKGTTVAWKTVPHLFKVKKHLEKAFGESAVDLKCEGNKYYKLDTGIGYHGDSERKKVIGVRLGNKMNIHFMWYYNDKPRGLNVSIILNPGDIYCMTEKTVGTDWRPNKSKGWLKKSYTLRHAAGSKKYTTDTPKIKIVNIEENDGIYTGDIISKK